MDHVTRTMSHLDHVTRSDNSRLRDHVTKVFQGIQSRANRAKGMNSLVLTRLTFPCFRYTYLMAMVARTTVVRNKAPRVEPKLMVISSFLVKVNGIECVSQPAKKMNRELEASWVDENLLNFPM